MIYAMLPFVFNHIQGKAFKYGTEQVLLQGEDGRIVICTSLFCTGHVSNAYVQMAYIISQVLNTSFRLIISN